MQTSPPTVCEEELGVDRRPGCEQSSRREWELFVNELATLLPPPVFSIGSHGSGKWSLKFLTKQMQPGKPLFGKSDRVFELRD